MNNFVNHLFGLLESNKPFSDIQIETEKPLMWRLPNGWSEAGYGKVAKEEVAALLVQINKDWKAALMQGGAVNATLHHDTHRLRCSLYKTCGGTQIGITIRVLSKEIPKLETLGLPIQVEQFANVPKGLLLVVGATGAGKTTTIASIINRINAQRNSHIIAIEEPIEYIHEPQKSIVTQREMGIGRDVNSYAQGVYEALRQCPDVIVIGEIRDTDTAEAVLHAAESGHFVMASLHARSAGGAIQKLLSFFPDGVRAGKLAMIANSLSGVIFQVRMPLKDKDGSVVAAEILPGGISMQMLQDPASIETALKENRIKGSLHLNTSLRQLIDSGKVDKKVAMAHSYSPEDIG